MADIEKLDLIIKHIKANPEQHRQSAWGLRTECGTAYCVAGWTGVIDQARMEWCDLDGGWEGWAELVGIGEYSVFGYAKRSLGLSDDQASALFCGSNRLDAIEQMRDALAADPDADIYHLQSD